MSTASSISSASEIQMDYMNLLITQLQNQNPLEPLDNNEMATQLAQFSQLAQIENMNTNFEEVLTATERTYANSLIGKEVSFLTKGGDGAMEVASGTVEQVVNDYEDEVVLVIGDYVLGLYDVVSVNN
jgi:flagellar basal-body rod modification protein FlgD